MPFGETLIGGALSALTGGLQRDENRKAQEREIAANRQLADLAYSRNVEMWNKQNEYNNPTSQMQRLQSAGLNPNLVYGTGAVGNQSGAPPQYTPPKETYRPLSNFPEVLSTYQNLKLQSADIKLKEQAFRNAQADGTAKEINNRFLEKMLKERNLKLGRDSQVSLLKTDTESKRAARIGQLAQKEEYNRTQGGWQADVERSIYDSRMSKLNYGFAEQLRPFGITNTDNLLVRWLATQFGSYVPKGIRQKR